MRHRVLLLTVCFLGLLCPIPQTAAATVVSAPTVANIRGKIVTVRVPAGYRSVTLRQRTGLKTAPWKTLGNKTVDAAGGNVKFTLRSAVALRALAVVGARTALSTTNAAAGIRLFGADPTAGITMNLRAGTGGLLTANATATDSVSLATSTSGAASVARTVTESDIWRIAGDRLYFFNQLRGLQVFDIANPDDPSLLGQLREPNRGEELYQLDATHLALLTRPSYYFGLYAGNALTLGSPSLDQGNGAVVIADVSAAQPREIARVAYPGYLVESRLVGSALYVVSNAYDGSRSGLTVTSFDLSDPTTPRLVATLNLGNYGGVVSATDRFLFVVRSSNDWRRSDVELIDISDPRGALQRRGTVTAAGRVDDKFKLHLEGNRLTVVSAIQWDWNGDRVTSQQSTRTAIENFDLTNPARPALLGKIEVGVGETVRATRFADGRLYVVTFFTIDPLWVIDYSTPQPTLLGELEVPGFSTYIEPLGDRLVAVGRIGSQTAVSLFDVSDPTQPRSLAQIPLGEGYSYSQANWDEKVLGVFPADNLIVVPYAGYDRATGYANRVQLIDLQRNSLRARGIIDHPFAARRSAVVNDRLLAISSSNLVTVDFADRDQPRVTSDVEIAWRVDRVFLAGQHLVQIGGFTGWGYSTTQPPTLTVSPADAPDTVLSELALPNASVLGATVRGDRLYIAQQVPRPWYGGYVVLNTPTTGSTTPPPPTNPLIVSVYDLSQLPALRLLGKTETDTNAGSSQLEAAWPTPGALVWVRPQNYYYGRGGPIYFGGPVLAARPSLAVADLAVSSQAIRFPYYWGAPAASHELFVYDVSNAAVPRFTAGVDVRTGQGGDWSAPLATGGKLYLSSFSYDETPESTGSKVSRRNRHFLRTVDFTNLSAPLVSSEVNIPGRLLAVANGGGTLLTTGCGFESDGTASDKRAFHLSRFDGTTATLNDQLMVPEGFRPFTVDAGNLFILNSTPVEIQGWRIGADEKFALTGKIPTANFTSLASVRGLVIGLGAGLPQLFDVSDPATPLALSTVNTRELTGYDFSTTAGGAALGLWQPLGETGIGVVKFPTAAPASR